MGEKIEYSEKYGDCSICPHKFDVNSLGDLDKLSRIAEIVGVDLDSHGKRLAEEIEKLFKPIYERLYHVGSDRRIYYMDIEDKRQNVIDVIGKIEQILFNQEIKNRINKALDQFMQDVLDRMEGSDQDQGDQN